MRIDIDFYIFFASISSQMLLLLKNPIHMTGKKCVGKASVLRILTSCCELQCILIFLGISTAAAFLTFFDIPYLKAGPLNALFRLDWVLFLHNVKEPRQRAGFLRQFKKFKSVIWSRWMKLPVFFFLVVNSTLTFSMVAENTKRKRRRVFLV